jgi:hypothetical protein
MSEEELDEIALRAQMLTAAAQEVGHPEYIVKLAQYYLEWVMSGTFKPYPDGDAPKKPKLVKSPA